MTTDAYLEHYGVKGMRWGQRRAERAAAPRQASYSTDAQAADKKKLGSRGVDRINENMSKGMDHPKARAAEVKRRQVRNTVIVGGYLAARALYVYGPMLAQQAANSYVGNKVANDGRKATADLFSDKRGISNHKVVDISYDSVSDKWG